MTVCSLITILCLAVLIFVKRTETPVGMTAALAACVCGDLILNNRGGSRELFLAGTAAFAAAQILFAAYAWSYGKRFSRMLFLMVSPLYLGYLVVFIFPILYESVFCTVILAYSALSLVTLCTAAAMQAPRLLKWTFVCGVVCLLLSDTIISFDNFLGFRDLDPLMIPLYGISQIAFTAGLLMKGKKDYAENCAAAEQGVC